MAFSYYIKKSLADTVFSCLYDLANLKGNKILMNESAQVTAIAFPVNVSTFVFGQLFIIDNTMIRKKFFYSKNNIVVV